MKTLKAKGQWASYAGSLGLGFVAAGILLALFQPERERIWTGFLIAGFVLVLVYASQNWSALIGLWGRRSTQEGTNSAILTLVVMGLLVAANYLADRHNRHWDFTETSQYTLSAQSVKILNGLDRKVHAILFAQAGTVPPQEDLLKLYADSSDLMSYEVLDQEAEPAKALPYLTESEPGIPFGTVVLETTARRERVSSIAVDEQGITNGLIRILKEGEKKLRFLGGHQERELQDTEMNGLSAIRSKLVASNYAVSKLELLKAGSGGDMRIPSDTSVLAIVGPRADFLTPEIDAIRSYVDAGGSLVVLLDPSLQLGATRPLALIDFLASYGIGFGEDVIFDNSGAGRYFGYGEDVPVVANYSPLHPITEDFRNVASLFPLLRSVSVDTSKAREGIEGTAIFSTSEASWGETDLDLESKVQQAVQPDADEQRGPIHGGFALTIPAALGLEGGVENSDSAPEGLDSDNGADDLAPVEARMVVVGDSDFITNQLAGAPIGNAELFLNIVNWVAQDEDLIAIRPKAPGDRRVFLNQQQQRNVIFLSVLILPGIIIATGFFVWWSRRG